MASKLIDIPNHQLDSLLNEYIKKSDKITIIVSFVFESGLNLIFKSLKEFSPKHNLRIITSNYLKSTEPKALRKLLELQAMGAKVLLFDSLGSKQNFHIKSYCFANSSDLFFKSIVGSSNLSFGAFKGSFEFNVETEDEAFAEDLDRRVVEILSHSATLELSEGLIEEYECLYEENNNVFLSSEKSDSVDEGDTEFESPDPFYSAEPIEVIPYKEPNVVQKDALEILDSDRKLGIKKGLVVMATGLGKTILAALDVQSFNPKRILFVAHRQEILAQSINAFKLFMPHKSYGLYQGGSRPTECEFLFAMIQTLGKKDHLSNFEKDHFDYIVVDEFHHVGARGYRGLVEYFEPKFFLGLTATPSRNDNIDILQYCGNNLLYKKDLIDGIKLDLLSLFDYRGINDKHVDYARISWRGKRFDEEDLTRNLNTMKRAEYVFENWMKYKQTRTLGFCASIKHSDFMAEYFSKKGVKAVSVHSKSSVNRDDALKQLKIGKIDILFSVDLFNEGIDLPAVDTIMMLRPTESKIIFLQQFGRGLRKATGKKLVRVIDFIGNHKTFLEKPAALFDFELNASSMKEFVEKYNNRKLDLPKGCSVFYDPEAIEFFEDYSRKRQDFVQLYKEYREDKGERPSAAQFYQFIGKLSNVRVGYNSWYKFIDAMQDLDQLEAECVGLYTEFFLYLEKTSMTKCFKMVVLAVWIENTMKAIPIDELCKKSFEYLRGTTNLWNETASEFKKDTLSDEEFASWKRYWSSNPLDALTAKGRETAYFKLSEDEFSLSLEIPEKSKPAFKKLVKELVDYRFTSYKIRFDLSYVQVGDIEQPFHTQIHKAFVKTDVPKLFKFSGAAASPGVYKMFGHARPPEVPHQFIYITLIKSDMEKDHRYNDYFKSDIHFHWQSRNTTTQSSDPGLDIINHENIKKDIHLFVRKVKQVEGRTLPFTYCGKIKFLNVSGNGPINVNFELERPLSERLKQEFLRV